MPAPKGNKYALGNKGGRPKKDIDWVIVEQLSLLQCTQEEIASCLGVKVDTLKSREEFLAIYKKGQDHGRMSLRRKQWSAANEGNTTMLIWLGKQYLGQQDKQGIDLNHNVTVRLRDFSGSGD